MATKKAVIKDLRQEIKELKAKVHRQALHINGREKQMDGLKTSHLNELDRIFRHTNGIAKSLQYRFVKDLSWLELTDDPESKIQHVKRAINQLERVAAQEDDHAIRL